MQERKACIGCISREACAVLRSHHGYWVCESWDPDVTKNTLIKEEQKR